MIICLNTVSCPILSVVMKASSSVCFKSPITQKPYDQLEWSPLFTRAYRSFWLHGTSPTDVYLKAEILVELQRNSRSAWL